MRERFELHCKTVGLIVFCVGVYSSLSSIALFFQKAPDITKMIPQSALKTLAPPAVAELQAATSYTWRYALITLVLSGIAPLLIGVYLMRSNNLFVRRCYPVPTDGLPPALHRTDELPKSSASRQVPERVSDEGSDSRYAPPGYTAPRE